MTLVRWRNRWSARLSLLGCALLASALLMEIGVTLLFGEEVKFPRRVVSAPWGLRINEPNSSYRHKSADVEIWFRINSQGMRADHDYAYTKPTGTRRIVSLGDSFTVGYEVAVEDSFSSVLERVLREEGHRVEVLNAGVSGFSTAEEYLYLERELWKYEPDLVLVSFYVNDYVDNVRTGLFGLEQGRLVARASTYVPAGQFGDFLNTNMVFNWLSGYSNSFALFKERLNLLVKRRMVAANFEQVEVNGSQGNHSVKEAHERDLAKAILEALYASTRSRGVPLVIQSIPYYVPVDRGLIEAFPGDFDLAREQLHFLSGKDLLEPYKDAELLYWTRSHWHWTPFSHRKSGERLARLIDELRLLER